MSEFPAEVQAAIERVAHERAVHPDTVVGWMNDYNAYMQRALPGLAEVAPYIVNLAAEWADPMDPRQQVNAAARSLQRIAATFWARAAGAHVPDALIYFNDNPKWDAGEFAKAYPITLPTTPEGLIDGHALMHSEIEGSLQRAIMFDLQASIAEASVWGGDDNWYDYLPNGILQLQSIQDEGWANIWADIWNTHPYGNKKYYSDEIEEDEQEALDDVEEKLAEKYGFYIQDVTSGFIYYFMRPHN